MNIAVLSDIHGNHVALEACMEYLMDKSIDAWFFLGDYIGEFPGIEQTLKILYDLQKDEKCYILRGNKEDYQLLGYGSGHPEWDAYPSTEGMLRYTNDHLTTENLTFFKSLPITQTVKIQGMQDIVICHGSPRKVNEKFMNSEKAFREVLAEIHTDYLICGHTHKRADVARGSKHIWNPGSVGASLDEPDRIPFLILHSDCGEWIPEFVSLKADTGRMIKEMRNAGLYEIAPFWTRISEYMIMNKNGAVSHGSVLSRAMAICREQYGECVWPRVPEECFKQAYEEMCQ